MAFTMTLSAQLNEKHVFVDVKVHETTQIVVNSLIIPTVKTHNYTLTDTFGFDNIPVSPNTYVLNYQSADGYFGDITTVIEYTEPSSISGISQKNYMVLHVQSRPSVVHAVDDNILHQGGAISINPLSNDSTTEDSLNIIKIGFVSGGTASILNGETIEFNPIEDQGYIKYFVEDDMGTISSATIHLIEENNSASESLEYFGEEMESMMLLVPSADFELDIEPSNGLIVQGSTNYVWHYTPDLGFTGLENLSFSSTYGGNLEFELDILPSGDTNSPVVNDEAYVVTDGTVSIDVLQNDYNPNSLIISHSSELTEISTGIYQYTPPSGFTGDKQFEYTVFTGTQVFVGYITIHVDDFAPTDEVNYDFQIIENQDLVLIHQTPTSDYFFNTVVEPASGSLTILDEFGEAVLECDSITGANSIIYTPNENFTGLDEFDIEYCTETGICEILKVDIYIEASNHTDCLCLQDCVFPGDHNDDGRVDMLDILDLGINSGEGGFERSNDFTEIWTGQHSTDWGYGQIGNGVDLKCGDSDGDGVIDIHDFQAVTDNYGRLHRLQSDLVAITTDIPVYFEPQQTEVDSGEVLYIDILVGDSAFPAIDMNGIAFSFFMNPELMDSSSVIFNLAENNWLSHQNPVTDFSITPADGQVDISVSRLGNSGADGIGLIGTLQFIVEDEIEGLKRAIDNKSSFPIEMKNIISINKFGERVRHPDFIRRVTSGGSNQSISDSDKLTLQDDLITYPNPTSGLINVVAENYIIDKLEVYNVLGERLKLINTSDSQLQIDLSEYTSGVYFVKITSGEETTTQLINRVEP